MGKEERRTRWERKKGWRVSSWNIKAIPENENIPSAKDFHSGPYIVCGF